MKKLFPLLLVFLLGCSGEDPDMAAALELRSKLLGAAQVRFEAEIAADYIDSVELCELACSFDNEGTMTFTVKEPQEVSGISGTVTGTRGTVTFDDTVLAFPLMADGRLSPLSAPWVLMKALREGYIVAVGREGELLHLTIDDSYADDALTVDIWIEGNEVEAAEISWQGRRRITMELGDFSVSA